MGIMRILDETGDTTVAWSVDDPKSVEHARRRFARQRCSAVPIARPAGAPASATRIITEFDPSVDEIIWARPVAGG